MPRSAWDCSAGHFVEVSASCKGLLERVLHLFAGLLDVGRSLVCATFGFLLLVTRHLADGLFCLARDVLRRVLHLVFGAHLVLLSRWTIRSYETPALSC